MRKLNLQLFAEPTTTTAPTTTTTTTAATPPATPTTTSTAPTTSNPSDIAEALMHAIEERSKRATGGVVKSMAEQYGMKPEELTALLEKAQAEKAKQLPPEVKQQLEAANNRVRDMAMAADVRALGAAMGLVDADTALLLLDKSKVKVDEKGAVTGMQEALDALKASKPYLFGATAKPMAWTVPQGTAPTAGMDGVEAAFFKRNPGLKPE